MITEYSKLITISIFYITVNVEYLVLNIKLYSQLLKGTCLG